MELLAEGQMGLGRGRRGAGHIYRTPFVIISSHAFRTCTTPSASPFACLAIHCDRNDWEKREPRRLTEWWRRRARLRENKLLLTRSGTTISIIHPVHQGRSSPGAQIY